MKQAYLFLVAAATSWASAFAGALPPPEVDCNWRRNLGVIHLQGNSNFGNLVLERIYRDEGTLPCPVL